MAQISNITGDTIISLRNKIREAMQDSAILEEAAQRFCEVMYREFKESIVLTRLFATIPFAKLPDSNQAWVSKLAASQEISSLVNDDTLVLSLLGTHGQEAAWCSRRNSEGHVGVPLASADFIDRIPMMSRLLKEMGLDLAWVERQDTGIVAKTMGAIAGVFYVPDAKKAVDHKGRPIIAAQDFVDAYQVETVFGLGGSYLTTGTFITITIFTREMLEKSQAERFMFLVNEFKAATMHLVSRDQIFAG